MEEVRQLPDDIINIDKAFTIVRSFRFPIMSDTLGDRFYQKTNAI